MDERLADILRLQRELNETAWRRASNHVHFAAKMRLDCTMRHGELEGCLAGVLCRQGHSLA